MQTVGGFVADPADVLRCNSGVRFLMADDWYVRSPEGERGPFGFPELLNFIREGRVGGADEVKCTLEGRWIRADAIDLHAAEGSGAVAELQTRSKQNSPRGAATKTVHSRWSILRDEILDRYNPRIVWLLVILGGWLCVNYFVLDALNPYAAEQNYELQFSQIYDEMQRYQQDNTTDAQWDAFATNSRQVVEPIIQKLQQNVSPEHPIRQHLLWAGRDCLLPALQNRQSWTPDLQDRLQQHLQQAQTLLSQARS